MINMATNWINPRPKMKPVINRRVLLDGMLYSNCIPPSIISGISKEKAISGDNKHLKSTRNIDRRYPTKMPVQRAHSGNW